MVLGGGPGAGLEQRASLFVCTELLNNPHCTEGSRMKALGHCIT